MARLAEILGRSVRTVQRHLHALKECGVVEFVERRRHRGRYSSYLYRVLFFVSTTGHERRMAHRTHNIERTRHTTNTPQTLPREAYNEWFGLPPDSKREQEPRKERTREDYKWFFGG
jgi:DNA-binding MarR family transcriptional regulator